MRSRLQTNLKKQNTKTIVAIIIILLALAIFGTQLLVGFASLLGLLKGQNENLAPIQSVDYISPPVINPVPPATKDKKINVSGFTTTQSFSVYLYVNSKLVDKIKPDKNSQFTFREVVLETGENEIKAKAENMDKKQSDYSEIVIVKYLEKPPTLEISSPQDGQAIKKDQSPIKVSGKTDTGVKVTINDFWAIFLHRTTRQIRKN